MAKKSAGLVLFRGMPTSLEVLLVHPGGPFWSKKDDGAWSIPKGEFTDEEQPLNAAIREFEEETGFQAVGEFLPLDPVKQPSGKVVYAFALCLDIDPAHLKSNAFTMEWPPKSGQLKEFPETDEARWFGVAAAHRKILRGQAPLLDQLVRRLGLDVASFLESLGRTSEHEPASSAPERSLFGEEG